MFFISEDSTAACTRYLFAGSIGSSIRKFLTAAVSVPVTSTLPSNFPARQLLLQVATMPSPELPVPLSLPPMNKPPAPAEENSCELAPPMPTTPEPPLANPLSGSAAPPSPRMPSEPF
jgi:hypothetical protein